MDSPRTAIVTGAASGLGRAIALELAARSWHVAVTDVDQAGSAETARLIREQGGVALVEPLNVTSPDDWRRLRGRLQAAWPAIDLLVNNAGVGMGGDCDGWSLEDWRWIIDINLYGAIHGCQEFLPWMKQNPRGSHLVNIASMAAIASPPGMAPYNVTKAGILALSETLHSELKPFKIGVTVVCPAFVPTNIVNNGRFSEDRQRQLADRLMNMSRCTPTDVAKRVAKAVERKKLYVFVPRVAGIIWRLKRLMPITLLKIVAMQRDKESARP